MTEVEIRELIRMVLSEMEGRRGNSHAGPEKTGSKILAVFTGGKTGLEAALKELQKLQKDGSDIEVMFSPSAEKIIGEEMIREYLGDVRIYGDQQDFQNGPQIFAAVDVLVIPVLTVNTLNKIANGIADTLTTFMVMLCLLGGKPVIAASDACDLSHEHRMQMGLDRANLSYLSLFTGSLNRIRSYGVTITCAGALCSAVKKAVQNARCAEQSQAGEKAAGEYVLHKRVLSTSDLEGLCGTVVIDSGTIITPSAKDMIHENHIQLIIR